MSSIIYKKMQSVYIVENENGDIKISVSQNVKSRVHTLSKQGGFKVHDLYYTEPCSNAYAIKKLLHINYKEQEIDGEWFRVPFTKAVDLLKTIFEEKACFNKKTSKVIYPEDIDRLFARSMEER